jgi:hypothetical protein
MTRLLRVLSTVNAGIWLGAGCFLTAAVGPAFFSPSVVELVGRQNAGLIAQTILAKYFDLQLVCAGVGLGLLVVSSAGRKKAHVALLVSLLALVVSGGFWIQPKLTDLNRTRYALTTTPDELEVVTKEFRRWHGVSQVGNLLIVIGSLTHLVVLACSRPGLPKALVEPGLHLPKN